MNYLESTIFIFVLLLGVVTLMIFTKSIAMMWIGFTIVPFFVIAQTYVVLKKGPNKESEKEFGEEWYDNK